MKDPTTTEMAEWGRKTLEFSANLVAGDDPSTEGEISLADLLGNLLHYSRRNEIDFEYALGTARRHFREECEEEEQAASDEADTTD